MDIGLRPLAQRQAFMDADVPDTQFAGLLEEWVGDFFIVESPKRPRISRITLPTVDLVFPYLEFHVLERIVVRPRHRVGQAMAEHAL